MKPDVVGTCAECTCEVIRQRAWDKATTDQRRTWLANDQRMLQGRGLCRACYLRAHKAGKIPRRPAATSPKATPAAGSPPRTAPSASTAKTSWTATT